MTTSRVTQTAQFRWTFFILLFSNHFWYASSAFQKLHLIKSIFVQWLHQIMWRDQFISRYIYQSNSPSCKANSNCHTNILLKPCATLMMTKLRDSAVFVPPSRTPLSETLELSNKQDRRGGSPSLEFSSPRVILHAGLVWLRACGSRCGGRTVEGPSPALPALLPTC